MKVIGRQNEKELLERIYESGKPEFVCLYGRRRVGKTFLINELFRDRMTFKLTAISPTSIENKLLTQRQLERFCITLESYGMEIETMPKDWFEAFDLLKTFLKTQKGRKVVFIDELPWLDTPRSHFLSAFENFWNDWGSTQDDLMLIVCGSATSWIVNKLLGNRGGLHNRLTRRIHLKPFTLHECELFYEQMGLVMSRHDQLISYMIMGGIPYYLSLMDAHLSLAQNIDKLFFSEDGELRKEYDYLFRSLYKHPEPYIKIIEALCEKPLVGIESSVLIEKIGKKSGGTTTTILNDLENCGFIRSHYPYKHKQRGRYYKICDAYTLFYSRFLKGKHGIDEHFWSANIGTPAQNIWTGIAFEQVCFAHIRQIKELLGIAGISTETTAIICIDEEGKPTSQIDMAMVRTDNVVNIFEIKFSHEPYRITKDEELALRRRIGDVRKLFPARYAIRLTMLTSMGLEQNKYSGIAQNDLSANKLFDVI